MNRLASQPRSLVTEQTYVQPKDPMDAAWLQTVRTQAPWYDKQPPSTKMGTFLYNSVFRRGNHRRPNIFVCQFYIIYIQLSLYGGTVISWYFLLPTLFLFPTTGILCLTQCHRDATSIDTMLELMTCDDRLPYIPNGNVRKLGRHRTILGANVFFIFFFYFRETPLVQNARVQNAHIYDTRAFLLLFVFVFVSYIYNLKK